MLKQRLIARHKDKGFRVTSQRLAVLEFLEGNTSHPSAEEIFQAVKQSHPTISFATVYNTLEMLRNSGEVLELGIDPARRRYDPNTMPHNHIVCGKCGKIGDVLDKNLNMKSGGFDIPGYTVSSWHIDFQGICLDCEREGR